MRFSFVLQFLVVLVLWPSFAISNQVPDLSLEQAEYDFGEVFQGEKVVHSFSFVNSGAAPLLIDRLKSSCGCTAALLSAKSIAPGAEGTIKATFDSTRFRGSVRKVIYLYSNLPGREKVQFALKGIVKPLIEYSPTQVDFGKVMQGDESYLDISLKNAGSEKLKIENIRANNTALGATTESGQLLPGIETTFRVFARPVKETLHLNGYILVRTDNVSLGEIRIPVRGVVER